LCKLHKSIRIFADMITDIRAKKRLGQHFLIDKNIARKITDSLLNREALPIIEVGAGTGVLSEYLSEKNVPVTLIDIDPEAVAVLKQKYSHKEIKIILGDFLKLDFKQNFEPKVCIIGNFPYNISSQIFFNLIANRDSIDEVVCMVQKEVAQRIAAKSGSKTYGILSVLLQTWFDIEYLFTVNETVFVPPPKVKSAVIRLRRNNTILLGCDESAFIKVVKAAFNQRRKTLRNALKTLGKDSREIPDEILDNRAEKLEISQFVLITDILFAS